MRELFDATTSDEQLVRAVRRIRSNDAFGVLYDRHTPRAYQTAWRLLGGDQHEAEDAVQEAWVRAVTTLEVWSGGGEFGAWLRGIVAHVAIDAVRKQSRLVGHPDVLLEVDDPPPGERL